MSSLSSSTPLTLTMTGILRPISLRRNQSRTANHILLVFAYTSLMKQDARRRVYMSFMNRKGWHVQFLEADLKTPLPRWLHFTSAETVIELVERGCGFTDQERPRARMSYMDGHVGIIFLHGNDLWIDSTPAAEAVDYGDLKTLEKGHPDYWQELQRRGAVPRHEEYDDVARGRVTFDTRKKLFDVFLDRCIRKCPEVVFKIFAAMDLPPAPASEVSGDSHYVCPGCRQGLEEDEG
jgi:hypothetical protein